MRLENSYIGVDGVGPKTEQKLWEAGAITWSDFDPSHCGATTATRIEAFIEKARPRLKNDDTAFFERHFPSNARWRLYENFRDDACFLDIETTGLDKHHNQITCCSFSQNGNTETLVAGDNLMKSKVREHVTAPLLVTFNGARFDIPFLEAAFNLTIDTPHLDLRYPCKRLGYSGGLKAIEPRLGIDRDRADLSGRDAIRLWHEHQQGIDGALDTLIAYNREDTVNLRSLADATIDRLDSRLLP